MFNKYGINITKEEMDQFFSQIDSNGDKSLNLEEFKKCVSDENANKCFTSMI